MTQASYPRAYVKTAREWMREQVQTYEHMAMNLVGEPDAALFERQHFANLLLALDRRFVDRDRAAEGDGANALGEVRLLVASIIEHSGRVHAEDGVAYDPAASVLKLPVGAPVAMTPKDFLTLAEAFLDAVGQRYPG